MVYRLGSIGNTRLNATHHQRRIHYLAIAMARHAITTERVRRGSMATVPKENNNVGRTTWRIWVSIKCEGEGCTNETAGQYTVKQSIKPALRRTALANGWILTGNRWVCRQCAVKAFKQSPYFAGTNNSRGGISAQELHQQRALNIGNAANDSRIKRRTANSDQVD